MVRRAVDTARRSLAAPALFAGVVFWGLPTLPALAQVLPAKAQVCAACHGADGNSVTPGSPSLAAQPRLFLENTLVMVREGLRDIAVMRGMLKGFTDAEISAVARFYSSQTLKPQPPAADAARVARGATLSKAALCGTCHLPDYSGREQMPRLSGQREDFLFSSMRDFRDGSATGRDTIMAATLRGMSDEELRDLAHYFAQKP